MKKKSILDILRWKKEGKANAQIERLEGLLTTSLVINVALISFSLYQFTKKSPQENWVRSESYTVQTQASASVKPSTSYALYHVLKEEQIQELVARLSDTKRLQDGFLVRDIALSILVQNKYFDLDRALPKKSKELQETELVMQDPQHGVAEELIVYKGLTDSDFKKVRAFAHREKWPLTAKGLFFTLKNGQSHDESLKKSFQTTALMQYYVRNLDLKEDPRGQELLYRMLMKGEYDIILSYYSEEEAAPMRLESKLDFLTEYFNIDSEEAAYFFVDKYPEYALEHFTEGQMLHLLTLLTAPSISGKDFAVSLITSPQTDLVWQEASKKLYQFSGKGLPKGVQKQALHRQALSEFVPKELLNNTILRMQEKLALKEKRLEQGQQTTAQLPKNMVEYTVQRRDSLWKIARKHKTNIQSIREANKLQTDVIRPGMKLQIPMDVADNSN